MEKNQTPFATRLRSLIEKRRTTIKAVAECIGITRQAVSQYCDGATQPNADTVAKIALCFNVSTDYLLGLSDNPTTDANLNAVCEYLGLSQKAVEMLMRDKGKDFHTTARVLECAEFWNIIYELRSATANKAYLEPSGALIAESIKEKLSDENNVPELYRKALSLVGGMGLAPAYKQKIGEEVISLFEKVVCDET